MDPHSATKRHSYPDAYRHQHAELDAYNRAQRDCDLDPYAASVCYRHIHSQSDLHGYPDPDFDTDRYANSHPDAVANHHRHAVHDGDPHPDAYTEYHANRDRYEQSHFAGDGYLDVHTNPDAHRNAHAHRHSDVNRPVDLCPGL